MVDDNAAMTAIRAAQMRQRAALFGDSGVFWVSGPPLPLTSEPPKPTELINHLVASALSSWRATWTRPSCSYGDELCAPVGAKLVELRVKRLPVGADAGIAKAAVLRFAFGHMLREA